jgi:hypothetical protein
LVWRRAIPLTLQNVLTFLDDQPGIFKIFLPEEHVFSLVKSSSKTYWLGVLRNSALWPRLKREEIVRTSENVLNGIKIKALTNCILIGKCRKSLKDELLNLLQRLDNPCIKQLLQAKIPLRFTVKETPYLQEFHLELKHFLTQSAGICPPAHCGRYCCEEAGGVSVPVIINREEIC